VHRRGMRSAARRGGDWWVVCAVTHAAMGLRIGDALPKPPPLRPQHQNRIPTLFRIESSQSSKPILDTKIEYCSFATTVRSWNPPARYLTCHR
jgi:hypothetical protein